MTCIVALEQNGTVYIGGDSAAVAGWDIEECAFPKVFAVGDFLIGYTSSFRMGQLLQYDLNVPENNCYDDMQYLVTKFIPSVRECLKSGGYAKIDNNREDGGTFIIGYRGRIYKVADDFQVLRVLSGFTSVGCGSDYALGAMEVLDKSDPERAVLRALEVSGKFSNGVRGPYTVLHL